MLSQWHVGKWQAEASKSLLTTRCNAGSDVYIANDNTSEYKILLYNINDEQSNNRYSAQDKQTACVN
jgi:hypothetical protein